MTWHTLGRVTNPVAGQVLSEVGPFDGDQALYPHFVFSANVACIVVFEVRDAANTTTIKSHSFPLGANSTFAMQPLGSVEIPNGGRIRAIANAGVTGVVQASIFL